LPNALTKAARWWDFWRGEGKFQFGEHGLAGARTFFAHLIATAHSQFGLVQGVHHIAMGNRPFCNYVAAIFV
jgi:hypothetical protein